MRCMFARLLSLLLLMVATDLASCYGQSPAARTSPPVPSGLSDEALPGMPPVLDPNNPDSIKALAVFVAGLSPGQDGFYVETAYAFTPHFMTGKFDDGAYIAPVVRYEAVRLDRTIPDFYLNRSRLTLGMNIAPSPSVIFKLNYLFNHTFGPIPNVPGGIGGAIFGENPLPHANFGQNGFTGSIAYVF